MAASQALPLPCFLVNNLTTSSIEQCKFVIDNDCLEDDSAIDYVYLVYCEFGHEMRHISILLIATLVIVLFLALSAIADEFLCPSLLTVAKNLRMSDSLAGVTLLAFGNGCPDIFSSLAAASGDRSELIVGELLGAGIFCTSIVSGLIFIHSDFKLACRPILRDTTFYLLAVYLIWFYCWTQKITFYGSLAFILIYLIYLVVALSGQAFHSRLTGDYAIAETQAQSIGDKKNNNENWFKWREESLRRKQIAQKEKKSETTALTSGDKLQKYTIETASVHLGSECTSPTWSQVSLEMQLYSSIKPGITDSHYINKAYCQTEHEFELEKSCTVAKPSGQSVVKIESKTATIVEGCNDLTWSELDHFLYHINPIDAENWYEASFLSKTVSLIRAPLLFAAIMTVPVVDSGKKFNNWCRPLNSLHCITVPFVMVTCTGLSSTCESSFLSLPIWALVLVPGIILAIFVLKTSSPQSPPRYHSVFAYFGFVMSILWIYLLATEIISLLKTVGIIFSMTDTAIGLGILAWGNSLGDIVANISLAEAGYPRMAIGASIGAPLLNLLLGFGLSFTISLRPGDFSAIEYSPTITLLCSTLAIILISLMLSTLAPPEKSKKPFGYALICGYVVYFALAVCLEYGILKV